MLRDVYKQYKNILFLLIYAVMTFPLLYAGSYAEGLDHSYVYAFNRVAFFDNIKVGRDFVITYGPLGFLNCAMAFNHCIIIAAVIYWLLFFGQLVLFYRIISKGLISDVRLAASLFILFLSSPASASDLFIQFCGLMALAALWDNIRDNFAWGYFTAVFVVGFLYKFSITIALLAAVIVFAAAKICIKDRKRLWMFAVALVLLPVSYLVYNPSVGDFAKYIKGGLEMSDGFGVAMSTKWYDKYLMWIVILAVLYISVAVIQFIGRDYENMWLMLWIAPFLFVSYKHGFIRTDTYHISATFIEFLPSLFIVMLMFKPGKLCEGLLEKNKLHMACGLLVMLLFTTVFVNYTSDNHPWQNIADKIHGFPEFVVACKEERLHRLCDDKITPLPEGFVEKIGDSSFTSYPWEISFIEVHPEIRENFVPLPALQIYSAYTPYLDGICADMFNGDDAPEYIVFSFDTVDNRIPLLEVPDTWKSIKNHYELCDYDKKQDLYLLHYCGEKMNSGSALGEGIEAADASKHERMEKQADAVKDTAAVKDTEAVKVTVADKDDAKISKSISVHKDSEIDLSGCSEVSIKAELSLVGRIAKLFWKIPEIEGTITYSDGSTKTGRILLNNLEGDITASAMPYDYETLENALNGDEAKSRITGISLTGEGMKFYKEEIVIELR